MFVLVVGSLARLCLLRDIPSFTVGPNLTASFHIIVHYSVAASMIAHLEMDDARKAFGTDMIEALSPLILDTEFSTTRPAIKTILNRIVEQVVDADKGADARKTHLLATMELGRLAEAQLLGEPLHQLSFQIHEIVRLM